MMPTTTAAPSARGTMTDAVISIQPEVQKPTGRTVSRGCRRMLHPSCDSPTGIYDSSLDRAIDLIAGELPGPSKAAAPARRPGP